MTHKEFKEYCKNKYDKLIRWEKLYREWDYRYNEILCMIEDYMNHHHCDWTEVPSCLIDDLEFADQQRAYYGSCLNW